MASGVRIADGSFDFAGGVDSGRIPTLQSQISPHGLRRDQLAWSDNATVRGGAISPRAGWKRLCTVRGAGALYQGGWLYDASHLAANPHLILSIGGNIYRVRVDADNSVENLSTVFGLSNSPTEPLGFMCQGEEFLIIQAGDNVTLPLFYDGTMVRRSLGLAGKELPPATAMDYYMGRLWYAQGRSYTAGDIVGGAAGTLPYKFRDAILKVTENPLAIGGDGFVVPTTAGNIRALRHAAAIDTALGQGQLYIWTRKVIYSLDVPVTRTAWIAATGANQPLQKVVQITQGSYGDRCIPAVNGDLFYQSPDGIRSLMLAIRYFQQWGNTPISRNENRILNLNNRALMRFASGIQFDNRMIQTALPYQTPEGVVFQALVPLDFDLISSLGEKLPPAWEGAYEALDFLQLFEGDFGGLQRSFAVIRSRLDGSIQVWELTLDDRFDDNEKRITWYFETPAYTWGKEYELKKLDGGEIWFDRLVGTVDMRVYYRPDADACWQLWMSTSFCSAKNTCEDVHNPICYPEQPYGEGYRFPVTLPTPRSPSCPNGVRPSNIAYQFQVKVVLHGFCRVRGVFVYALPFEKAPFNGLSC